MSFFYMVDWDEFAVVGALGWDPELLLIIVCNLLAVKIVLVEEYALHNPFLVDTQSPPVELPQNEMGHDFAAKGGEDESPPFK